VRLICLDYSGQELQLNRLCIDQPTCFISSFTRILSSIALIF
jgi:hypothetical protein